MRAKKDKKKVKELTLEDFAKPNNLKHIVAVDTDTIFYYDRNSMSYYMLPRKLKDAINIGFGRMLEQDSVEEKVKHFEEEQNDLPEAVLRIAYIERARSLHRVQVRYMQNPRYMPNLRPILLSCSVCGNYIHYPGNFPVDFPDKWKLCCKCHGALTVGTSLYSEESWHSEYELRIHGRKYERDFDRLFKLEVL